MPRISGMRSLRYALDVTKKPSRFNDDEWKEIWEHFEPFRLPKMLEVPSSKDLKSLFTTAGVMIASDDPWKQRLGFMYLYLYVLPSVFTKKDTN